MVKVTSHENIAGVGHCTLVSAGFFDIVVINQLTVAFKRITKRQVTIRQTSVKLDFCWRLTAFF